MAVAFVLAIGSAFTTNIKKHNFNPTGYYTSDCSKSGVTNSTSCSTTAGSTNCFITILGNNLSPVADNSTDCGNHPPTGILKYNP